MSEQQADLTSVTDAGPAASASDAPSASDFVSATGHVESPKLAPEQGELAPDQAKIKSPRDPGRIMIMSPTHSDNAWHHETSWEDAINQPEPEADQPASSNGKRQMSMLAAVVALAAITGAVTGALATAGLGHFMADDSKVLASRALEESVMRMDADIAALKISAERAGKQNVSQFGKTTDRLDRIEKAQADPAAKLAKLSDAVEKLRTAPPTPAPAPVPVAAAPAKEITGSIAAPVPTPAPKPEVARLPTLDGWVLLDVANGGATIEGRQGMFEVYAGDPVPGLGRVDAIRKQDGHWVVVTSKGLVVAR